MLRQLWRISEFPSHQDKSYKLLAITELTIKAG
jgi:hypothetical protein